MARKSYTGGLRKIRNVRTLRGVCIYGPDSLILFFYSVLLFYFSTRSNLPSLFFPFILTSPLDKLFHFIEYGILGFLWMSCFRNFQWKSPRAKVLMAILICTIYSMVDEWIQSVTPNRVSSGTDIVADLLGSSAGIFLARVLWRNRFVHNR